MGEVAKGGNAFVPSVPLRIAVRNGLDTSAWLLTADGRVRGDGDIVFHGAPAHPSGAVRLAGVEDGTVWLEAGLTAVEEEIVRVLVVGATQSGAMRDVAGLSVEALAPDGTSVARYEVTDGGGETVMVLAELYRRAGGWKFRAVGQGYLDGLVGLAADHGVDVTADDGPRPAPAPAPVPAPTVAVPHPVPPPAVTQPIADWSFGAVFEPYEQHGRDNDVITVDGLPPGPVILELTLEGGGYTGLWTLDRRNKQKDNLVNSTEHAFRGRLLTVVPESGRLRLRLQADGPWQLRVLPLAAGRRLTEEWLECGGPDVLLHTAGTADLAIRYRGDRNLIVHLYELAGYDDPTTLPTYENAVNEIGKRRETVPLPEGPVIVQLEMADGPWQARLKGLRPHSAPPTPMPVPAAAPVPAPAVAPIPAPGKVPEPRKVRDWLRLGRR
ncbi:TerD family protein [Streptomyces sp. ME19-01-6]|uniref:TerD family protein n=1 Tax=Streptomyces sp. ME19-01-6 TaxID=3028686 RepID=UPI0029A7CC8E|nr:TerD family protein [Streptomyces sp. ME19-01-6]MDX3224371.1 TerD family protein [Streptomyces sp. ME19-01-6]